MVCFKIYNYLETIKLSKDENLEENKSLQREDFITIRDNLPVSVEASVVRAGVPSL